ncbi:MAG TPA: glycosyl transferase, partial [Candidatus Limnocylindria bacterium]|nr:glycosyl transferase [Candidatus Limnocylindria bacterium]
FSILSRDHLATLSVVSELWNHYAASVYKARLPVALLPSTRGTRFAGESKLNFVSLSTHGLSAISVFAETVGVRLMFGIGIIMLLSLALVGVVVAVRLGTAMAIPGWATSAVGLLLIIVLQMLTLVVGLTFSVLFSRNNLTFLPSRDYRYFIGDISIIYGDRE